MALSDTDQTRSTGHVTPPRPVRPDGERKGPGAAILLVLAPLVCCGGPLILAGLATASAATLGTVGGIVAAVLVALAAGIWIRRRRRSGAACCPPASGAWSR